MVIASFLRLSCKLETTVRNNISKEPCIKTERWVIKRLCVLEKHQVWFFHSTKREKIDEFYWTSIKKVKFRYCEKPQNLKRSPNLLTSEQSGRFFKYLWPSKNIWTLVEYLKMAQLRNSLGPKSMQFNFNQYDAKCQCKG